MRILILLNLLILTSCATDMASDKYSLFPPETMDQTFVPYVDDYILQKELKDEWRTKAKKIVINFSSKVSTVSSEVGICVVKEFVEEREILVSRYYWNSNPKMRQYYISDLMEMCLYADIKDRRYESMYRVYYGP